jgi:hypothetical protein
MVTASICRVVRKYLCGSVPLCSSEVGLIERSLLWPLVATGLGDITVCLSLLWITNKRVEYETI